MMSNELRIFRDGREVVVPVRYSGTHICGATGFSPERGDSCALCDAIADARREAEAMLDAPVPSRSMQL
jgi:hypothetical protein